ncbi:hypothetical protein HYH02_011191 [Chlamydomonas schloesseri]|uniref:Uncharacterized protein n=1 Tax=Chlamydomonas schloesseri TaxID=2026947 RepID=A0A835W572_9CHLO|nr:hypothetical protein HYH02_011191 [Chlamydomonas schloesseri]|eukprot:KAG2437549.1 hypothetical protein HYH02_011191 [Chlamydomonas schloesseri]
MHPSRLCRSVSVQELAHTEGLAAETCVRAGVAAGKSDGRVRLGRRSATSSAYADHSSHGSHASSSAPFFTAPVQPMAVGTAPSALGPTLTSTACSPFTIAGSASCMLGSSGAGQRWTQSARSLFSTLPGLCEAGLSDAAEAKQHGGRGREPIEKRVWGGRLLRSQSKEPGTMLSMLSMLDSMGALPLTTQSEAAAANTPPASSGPVTGNGTSAAAAAAAALSAGAAPATPPSGSSGFWLPGSSSFGGAGAGAGSSSAVNMLDLSRSSLGAAAVFGLNRLSSLDSCTLHQLDRALSSASLEAAAHAAAVSVHAATVHAASAARAVQQAAAAPNGSHATANCHAANGANGHAASPTLGSSSSSIGLAASTPTRGVSLSSLSVSNGLPAIHKVRPVGSVASMSLSLPAVASLAAAAAGTGPASSATMTRQDSTLFEFAEEQASLAAAAVAAAQVGGSVSGGCGYYSTGLSGLVGSFGGGAAGTSMFAHLTSTGNGQHMGTAGIGTGPNAGAANTGGGSGLSGPNDFLVLLSASSSHIASVSASPNHHQPAVSLAALLAAGRSSSGGGAALAASPGSATAGAAAAHATSHYSFSAASQLCGISGNGTGPGSIPRFVDSTSGGGAAVGPSTTAVVSPRAVADRAAAAAAATARAVAFAPANAAAASPTAGAAASSPAAGSAVAGTVVPKIKTSAAPAAMSAINVHGAPDMRAFAFSSPEDFFAAAAVLMDARLPSVQAASEPAAAGASGAAGTVSTAGAAAASDLADTAAVEDARTSSSSVGTATTCTAATLTTGGSSKGLFSTPGSSVSPNGLTPLAAEATDCSADA